MVDCCKEGSRDRCAAAPGRETFAGKTTEKKFSSDLCSRLCTRDVIIIIVTLTDYRGPYERIGKEKKRKNALAEEKKKRFEMAR